MIVSRMIRTLVSLITTLAILHLAAPASEGQRAARVYRIGLLSSTPAPFFMEPFAAEMRERGWVEGQHFTWERRFTGANPNSATVLARELVDLQVDVIVTAITGNAIAARRASARIPIVMVSSGYPVEAGLAQSLAMPGGNVTGNATYVGGKVFGKYLEFLRTLSPRLTRLGVLWDYVPPAATPQEVDLALGELKRAALALRITVKLREVRAKTDVDHALADFAKDRVDALFVTSGPVHADAEIAGPIIEFARRQRIPTMSDFAGGFFKHGGLLAYSPSPAALGRRAAYFVDRILRGANPADLPIEQPSKFDVIINARTARAIGLTIPPALLAQADQIIE